MDTDTNIDRTWTRHPTSTGIGVDRGSVCAHCGLRSPQWAHTLPRSTPMPVDVGCLVQVRSMFVSVSIGVYTSLGEWIPRTWVRGGASCPQTSTHQHVRRRGFGDVLLRAPTVGADGSARRPPVA